MTETLAAHDYSQALTDAIELEEQVLGLAKTKIKTPLADRPLIAEKLYESTLGLNLELLLSDIHYKIYAMLRDNNVAREHGADHLSPFLRSIVLAADNDVVSKYRPTLHCIEAEPSLMATLDLDVGSLEEGNSKIITQAGRPVGIRKVYGQKTTYFIEDTEVKTSTGSEYVIPADSIVQFAFNSGHDLDHAPPANTFSIIDTNEVNIYSADFMRFSNFNLPESIRKAIAHRLRNTKNEALLSSGALLAIEATPESIATRVREIHANLDE